MISRAIFIYLFNDYTSSLSKKAEANNDAEKDITVDIFSTIAAALLFFFFFRRIVHES